MAGFREALAIVFEAEGGLVDDPHDKGGRTKLGIAADTWERWRGRVGKASAPVDDCTREDAEYIYHQGYWLAGKCDGLPWPLSLVHFDSMVQHKVAAQLLQRSLGVPADGIIGRRTLEAAGQSNPREAAENLIWIRLDYYDDRETWVHHGKGWLRRMIALRRYVTGARPLPRVA